MKKFQKSPLSSSVAKIKIITARTHTPMQIEEKENSCGVGTYRAEDIGGWGKSDERTQRTKSKWGRTDSISISVRRNER